MATVLSMAGMLAATPIMIAVLGSLGVLLASLGLAGWLATRLAWRERVTRREMKRLLGNIDRISYGDFGIEPPGARDPAFGELFSAVAAMAQRMGYQTQVAGNGRDALAALEGAAFGFVVTDLRMPHVDGFELIETINALPEAIRPRVIVVTGKVLDEAETRQLDGKVMGFLPKNGLSPRKLAENVARVSAAELALANRAA